MILIPRRCALCHGGERTLAAGRLLGLFLLCFAAKLGSVSCFYNHHHRVGASWKSWEETWGCFATKYDADVAIVSSGIQGKVLAYFLQKREKCKVVMIDTGATEDPDQVRDSWDEFYGVFSLDWEKLNNKVMIPGLEGCILRTFDMVEVWGPGLQPEEPCLQSVINTPYVYVDKYQVESIIQSRYERSGGITLKAKLDAQVVATNIFDKNIAHEAEGSLLMLENGDIVRCKTLIDSTGPESKLVEKCRIPESNQIAKNVFPDGHLLEYSIICHVKMPYDQAFENVRLFDFSTDYVGENESSECPSSLRVVPLGPQKQGGLQRVLFSESLLWTDEPEAWRVGPIGLRARLRARLAARGVAAAGAAAAGGGEEAEHLRFEALGGELPSFNQRIIASADPHPIMGQTLVDSIGAADSLASVVGSLLKAKAYPDAIAREAYGALYGGERRSVRAFQNLLARFLREQRGGGAGGDAGAAAAGARAATLATYARQQAVLSSSGRVLSGGGGGGDEGVRAAWRGLVGGLPPRLRLRLLAAAGSERRRRRARGEPPRMLGGEANLWVADLVAAAAGGGGRGGGGDAAEAAAGGAGASWSDFELRLAKARIIDEARKMRSSFVPTVSSSGEPLSPVRKPKKKVRNPCVYTFEQARARARRQGHSSVREFLNYPEKTTSAYRVPKNPDEGHSSVREFLTSIENCSAAYRVPKNADEIYADEWLGWEDFLGLLYLYDECRRKCCDLGIQTQEEYRERLKGLERFPYMPDKYYREEWVSWEDFLSPPPALGPSPLSASPAGLPGGKTVALAQAPSTATAPPVTASQQLLGGIRQKMMMGVPGKQQQTKNSIQLQIEGVVISIAAAVMSALFLAGDLHL